MKRRGDLAIAFALAAAALAVRLWFMRYTGAILEGDGAAQAVNAGAIFRGERTVFDTYFPNLYLLLFQPLLHIRGGAAPLDLEWTGRVISMAAGALTVVPVFLFARTFLGRRSAVLAGLLIALHPDLIDFSLRVKTDSLFTFFVALSAYALWSAVRGGGLARYLLTGVSLGLTYYTRVEGLTYFLLALLIIAIAETRSAKGFFTRTVPAGLLTLLGFSFFLIPYQRYLIAEGIGPAVSDTSGLILFKSQKMFEEEVFGNAAYRLQDSVAAREAGSYSKENLDQWTLSACLRKREFYAKMGYQIFKNFFHIAALLGALLPFTAIGAAVVWFRLKKPAPVLFAFSFLALIFAVTMIMLSRKMYFIQALPLMLVFAAAGALACLDAAFTAAGGAASAGRRRAAFAAVAALFAAGVGFWANDYMKDIGSQHPVEIKKAGLWAAKHLPKDAIVMDYYGFVVFYSGMKKEQYVNTPFDTLENCLAAARRQGVDFWVVSRRFTTEITPQLNPLLEMPVEQIPLKTVYADDGRWRVRIFDLRPLKNGAPPIK